MSGIRLSWLGGKGGIVVGDGPEDGEEEEEEGGGSSMEASSSRSSLCGESGAVVKVAGWKVGEVRRAMTAWPSVG